MAPSHTVTSILRFIYQAGSTSLTLGPGCLLPPIVVVGQPSSYPVGHHGSRNKLTHMGSRSVASSSCIRLLAVGRVQHPSSGHMQAFSSGRVVINSHVAGVVVVAVEWHVLVCVCVPVKPTRGNTT